MSEIERIAARIRFDYAQGYPSFTKIFIKTACMALTAIFDFLAGLDAKYNLSEKYIKVLDSLK